MTGIEESKTIKNMILNMKSPFNISDIIQTAGTKNIKNKRLILSIVDELCDSEILQYSEISDGCWAFNLIK